MRERRVAIVHDWMVSPGGAERMLLTIHQMWPDAPIYTAAFSPERFPDFEGVDIKTTWLNRIPLAKRKHQLFSIPRAMAFKSLDLSEYDIVISSCSAESKYIKTGPQTLHICYCHTPIRYYWSDYDWYMQHPPFGRLNWLARIVLPVMIGPLKRMDYKAAQAVNIFVANSKTVQDRIKRYYDRESVVIYPPIDAHRFTAERVVQDYYIIVGRQVAYKRLDLAVDAFNRLGYKLKVVGVGEELDIQKPRSNSNIEYIEGADDSKVNDLLAHAKGFIHPQEEDFGMTLVEAMAAGCPVIAYGKGGAAETMVEGETGLLFYDQTAEGLTQAIRRFEQMTFQAEKLRARAAEFDEVVFKTRLKALVEQSWKDFKGKRREIGA